MEIQEVLFDEQAIGRVIEALANEINSDYEGKEIILVGLLKGSVVFMSDLLRKIKVPCEIDFMVVSSYGASTVSSGKVDIIKDLSCEIKNKNVIVVEDIVDSGNTLGCVLELLRERNPSELRLCSFLSKPSRREKNIIIDYLGAEIPDKFVVGYGLDFDEKFRNLPYIAVLNP